MLMHGQDSGEQLAGPLMVKGALAGTIATLPMTLFMLAVHRFLPKEQHYALPPEMITKELSRRVRTNIHHHKQRLVSVSTLSHFGYGAVMGALYSPLENTSFLPAPVRGMLFGLGVWAGSYLGLLPLLRFRASGHREPGERNLLMLVAHVIWGSTLGATADLLTRPRRQARGT